MRADTSSKILFISLVIVECVLSDHNLNIELLTHIGATRRFESIKKASSWNEQGLENAANTHFRVAALQNNLVSMYYGRF